MHSYINLSNYHLNTGQDTLATPQPPVPMAKSSALPLKSLISLPVLTSKILSKIFCKKRYHVTIV